MSSQHKRPILAFVVLAVIAAAVVGNQFRASAEGSGFIAAGRITAHMPAARGAVPMPAAPMPAAEPPHAAAVFPPAVSADAGQAAEPTEPDRPKRKIAASRAETRSPLDRKQDAAPNTHRDSHAAAPRPRNLWAPGQLKKHPGHRHGFGTGLDLGFGHRLGR